ncbi:hypothetical protein SLEP1_g50799 [Rubroshorea leprosula]|uniref:Uncharacterized protein n=1 Tax=Rubroshorea leprosula TaxID=152421 RepID=A0AAV5M1E6_9ROSI|nr:hypothetical protein SLEP1_g50799 [Rubroshorea leprosula]
MGMKRKQVNSRISRKNGFAAVEWIMSFFAWGVAENYVAYLFVSREKE